jgi:hypothetical protein
MGDLIVWTERFREWLARQVVQPFVRALDAAHDDANKLLAPLSPDKLPPLEEALAGGGGGGGKDAAGGGGKVDGKEGGGGGGGDVDVMVAHLMAMAEQNARGAAASVQQQLMGVYKVCTPWPRRAGPAPAPSTPPDTP